MNNKTQKTRGGISKTTILSSLTIPAFSIPIYYSVKDFFFSILIQVRQTTYKWNPQWGLSDVIVVHIMNLLLFDALVNCKLEMIDPWKPERLLRSLNVMFSCHRKQLIITCRCWLICQTQTIEQQKNILKMKWNGIKWKQLKAGARHGVINRSSFFHLDEWEMRKREINVSDGSVEWSEN